MSCPLNTGNTYRTLHAFMSRAMEEIIGTLDGVKEEDGEREL